MTKRPANLCTITEYYLNNQPELDKLTKDQQAYFWAQRGWHPHVREAWIAGIDSKGTGTIYYPDGSSLEY